MWAYVFGDDYLLSTPAIGSNNTIYVGSDDDCLYAITTTGNVALG